MREPRTPHVEAIDRALALLIALADAGPAGSTLAELSKAAEVDKATAYRALSTLKHRGFATQSGAQGSYVIGPAAMQLADRAFTPRNLARALHPGLVAISRAADELVHLGILVGDQVQYLDKVEPEHAIRVWSAVGQLVPVASTSMGRALLAARSVPDEQLDGYLSVLPPDRSVSLDRLRDSVVTARVRGYAVELGENQPDVGCVGVPILSSGTAVAALSITAPMSRMGDERQRELGELIHRVLPPLLPEGLSLTPDPPRP